MFRSRGQSDAKTPSVQFPSKLGIHLSTHGRDERLSRSCPARDLNPGPVAWKRDSLPLNHWAYTSENPQWEKVPMHVKSAKAQSPLVEVLRKSGEGFSTGVVLVTWPCSELRGASVTNSPVLFLKFRY
ncbi:hypothetical protein TNCV_94341 [Trichonephila clavipes]|nr:hypothetical protein TNCV_94341 [Trichonephila clavipes]